MKATLSIIKCVILDIEQKGMPVTIELINESLQDVCGAFAVIDYSITEEERQRMFKKICRYYHLNWL